jgi:hypothetical protein
MFSCPIHTTGFFFFFKRLGVCNSQNTTVKLGLGGPEFKKKNSKVVFKALETFEMNQAHTYILF